MSVGVGRTFETVCLSVRLFDCLFVHSIIKKNEWPKCVQTWCYEMTLDEVTWLSNWKVKDQGHTVNITTQWHFIPNYNRASFTFARWRYWRAIRRGFELYCMSTFWFHFIVIGILGDCDVLFEILTLERFPAIWPPKVTQGHETSLAYMCFFPDVTHDQSRPTAPRLSLSGSLCCWSSWSDLTSTPVSPASLSPISDWDMRRSIWSTLSQQ